MYVNPRARTQASLQPSSGFTSHCSSKQKMSCLTSALPSAFNRLLFPSLFSSTYPRNIDWGGGGDGGGARICAGVRGYISKPNPIPVVR